MRVNAAKPCSAPPSPAWLRDPPGTTPEPNKSHVSNPQAIALSGPQPVSNTPDVLDQRAAVLIGRQLLAQVEDELVHAPVLGALRPPQRRLGQRVPGDSGASRAGQHLQGGELGRGQGQVPPVPGVGHAAEHVDADGSLRRLTRRCTARMRAIISFMLVGLAM